MNTTNAKNALCKPRQNEKNLTSNDLYTTLLKGESLKHYFKTLNFDLNLNWPCILVHDHIFYEHNDDQCTTISTSLEHAIIHQAIEHATRLLRWLHIIELDVYSDTLMNAPWCEHTLNEPTEMTLDAFGYHDCCTVAQIMHTLQKVDRFVKQWSESTSIDDIGSHFSRAQKWFMYSMNAYTICTVYKSKVFAVIPLLNRVCKVRDLSILVLSYVISF